MKFYADLHIHSRFSRATSKSLNLEALAVWAQLKGLQVIGTGDCFHPGWLAELEEYLEPAEDGFFKLKRSYEETVAAQVPKACRGPVRFVLSAEISNIYKRLDKVRKVHNVIYVPSFDAAKNIQKNLDKIGNIRSDGRPILGLDSRNLLEIVLDSDRQSFLVPAHIWTPWFSVLGSRGGFDRIEDCFADLTKHVFAIETGLSSDPPMNWRLSQLDRFILISNSDAHSAEKLGRESNIFDTDFSYSGIYRALSNTSDSGMVGTIEFFPEEGKYHYDGHRNCNQQLSPQETIKNNGLCPVCGRPVTVGVLSRVEELADHPQGRESPRSRPYKSLIPLPEIIAQIKGMGVKTKGVQRVYMEMLAKLGSEIAILQDILLERIQRGYGGLLAEGIRRTRVGEVHIDAGYDGEFGRVEIFSPEENASEKTQFTLF